MIYKLPSYSSEYNLGDGRITMSPTTGLTSLQNQTTWTIELWFKLNAINTSAAVKILLDTKPPFTGGNQEGIVVAIELDGGITCCDVMSDTGNYYLCRPAENSVLES